MEEETATLEWYVKSHYTKTFTRGVLEQIAKQERLGVEGESFEDLLDAIGNWLDKRDWRADEFLSEQGTDSNWLATVDAELIDIREDKD